MLLIHNQIFIEEKRARTFRETSLSRGKRRRGGQSFPKHPEYAESAERRAINFLPPPGSLFSLSISAGTFSRARSASWKNERRSKRAQCANTCPARRKGRERSGIAVDVYRELKGSKGMDVFRANGEWNVESLTRAFRPPYTRALSRFSLRPSSWKYER